MTIILASTAFVLAWWNLELLAREREPGAELVARVIPVQLKKGTHL